MGPKCKGLRRETAIQRDAAIPVNGIGQFTATDSAVRQPED
jgi:hypothetical protein